MSWFKVSAVFALLVLGACGFQPVLKEGSSATSFANSISIESKDGRENFEFRDRLIDRLGAAEAGSRYSLSYALQINESVVTVSVDSSIDRYTLLGTVDFTLYDNEMGQIAYSDRVRASSGYSATTETFPTRVAAQDARIRLVQSLADQLIQVLQLNADDIVK